MSVSLDSKPMSSFTIVGGLAIPNKEINNIFNSNKISTIDTNNPSLTISLPDAEPGYSLSAKLSFELSESAHFFGGFGLSGFSKKQFDLFSPTKKEENGFLEIKTNVYSIDAGIHYYIIDASLGVYGIANLSYNFIASSVTKIESSASLRLPNNPTDSRLGFTVGLGVEIPLNEFSIIIESKYSSLNYIGKVSDESTKSLLLIQAGFVF